MIRTLLNSWVLKKHLVKIRISVPSILSAEYGQEWERLKDPKELKSVQKWYNKWYEWYNKACLLLYSLLYESPDSVRRSISGL